MPWHSPPKVFARSVDLYCLLDSSTRPSIHLFVVIVWNYTVMMFTLHAHGNGNFLKILYPEAQTNNRILTDKGKPSRWPRFVQWVGQIRITWRWTVRLVTSLQALAMHLHTLCLHSNYEHWIQGNDCKYILVQSSSWLNSLEDPRQNDRILFWFSSVCFVLSEIESLISFP